ncbi:MAG: hypothetical protein JXA97_12945 [Anaerolineales bacterium]|nr:hypothetical protein [Anaerolineales bacterium]
MARKEPEQMGFERFVPYDESEIAGKKPPLKENLMGKTKKKEHKLMPHKATTKCVRVAGRENHARQGPLIPSETTEGGTCTPPDAADA